jgi:hypothetical protein
MSKRIVVATIGVTFSLFCIFAVIVTSLGKNVVVSLVATSRSNPSYYKLGFATLYGTLTPFGLSGLLGAVNRKKALIRGFIWQYWLATVIIIGANCGGYLFAHTNEGDMLRTCQNQNLDVEPPVDCLGLMRKAQLNALIAIIAQGATLILVGLVLLIVGRREFKDIQFDESTSSLLEKQEQAEALDRFTSPTVSSPDTVYPSSALYRAQSNSSRHAAYGLEHKPSIASSTSSYGRNRQPNTYQRNPANGGGDWYLAPNSRNPVQKSARSQGLYRQATNASAYSTRTDAPPYERVQTPLSRPLSPAYVTTPERAYTNDIANNLSSPSRAYEGGNIYGNQNNGVIRTVTPPADDFDNYWQPAAAKTLARNVNRMHLY